MSRLTNTQIKQVVNLYDSNPKLKQKDIVEITGISKSSVSRIIQEHKAANDNIKIESSEEVETTTKTKTKTVVKTSLTLNIGKQVAAPKTEDLTEVSQDKLIKRLIKAEARANFYSNEIKKPTRACDTSENARVLLISDLHAPYHHPDALSFLRALHAVYAFDRIIIMGDEMDLAASSRYPAENGMYSKDEEERLGKAYLRELHDYFPEADLIPGNHSDNRYRGPLNYVDWIFSDEIAPGEWRRDSEKGRGWKQTDQTASYYLNDGSRLFIAHSIQNNSASYKERAYKKGCHLAQGHHHSWLSVDHVQHKSGLLSAVTTGCLVDPNAPCFNYARNDPKYKFEAALGCGAFINGHGKVFPMPLDQDGRWTGEIV